MRRTIILLAAAVMALSLSACADMKKELGVGRNSPDEFAVVKRAPLTLPPDYDLRPPAEGATPPAADASNQAKTALMGEEAAAAPAASKGSAEDALLQKMGADKANPSIRSIISQENGYLAIENKKLVDRLIFWNDEQPSDAEVPASVINAKAEAARLKKNQEEGKPINSGDVPVIEHKTGAFGKIF